MISKTSFPNSIFFFLLISLTVLFSCNSNTSYKKAEDAQDAGRQFIRASLDGDYYKARYYMLNDRDNISLLQRWKLGYDKLDDDSKSKYKEADILPLVIKSINDSVTSYTYLNSYKKDTTTIKILRVKGEWQVDMKEIINSTK